MRKFTRPAFLDVKSGFRWVQKTALVGDVFIGIIAFPRRNHLYGFTPQSQPFDNAGSFL